MILSLVLPFPLHAEIQIAGTRVIYPANEPEVSVKVTNTGQRPTLIQSWIDAGDSHSNPTNAIAPFAITPPIARIDPGKSQTLRISYIPTPLPADVESLFFLNIKEIPPKPDAQEGENNWLQLAFRSRLKLFFRPSSLHGSVQEALPQLRWQLTREKGTLALRVQNRSPYYITLTTVELRAGGDNLSTKKDPPMLAPGKEQTLLLNDKTTNQAKGHTGAVAQTLVLKGEPPAGAQVHMRAINEQGGDVELDSSLTP